jgi:hypothetical protein
MAEKKLFHILDLQGNRIKGVGAPSDSTDVATQGSAQAQADAAQAAAISAAATDATTKANAAQAAAEATAATLANEAQAAAISAAAADATTKANTAESNANTYTDGKIADLINDAPEVLDTLNELAAALGNDENFASTVTTSLAGKTNKYAVTITGPGTLNNGSYEYPVQHDLNKADIVVQAFEGNDSVDVLIRKVNNDSLKVLTGSALGSTQIRIVVVG